MENLYKIRINFKNFPRIFSKILSNIKENFWKLEKILDNLKKILELEKFLDNLKKFLFIFNFFVKM